MAAGREFAAELRAKVAAVPPDERGSDLQGYIDSVAAVEEAEQLLVQGPLSIDDGVVRLLSSLVRAVVHSPAESCRAVGALWVGTELHVRLGPHLSAF